LAGRQLAGATVNTEGAFPGAHSSAYLYFMAPRIILFRVEQSRRTPVEEVGFVSAPGTSPPTSSSEGCDFEKLDYLLVTSGHGGFPAALRHRLADARCLNRAVHRAPGPKRCAREGLRTLPPCHR